MISSRRQALIQLESQNSSYERNKHMNNIIKKVSAFAMAFTLLGAGTARDQIL